ncbi:hypothetical protein CNR22_14685 [Sphingobacteriaceae bacterium]|nr:hypothetical protein CNR22_14685 [Sphingobacteriaceae bacterium]
MHYKHKFFLLLALPFFACKKPVTLNEVYFGDLAPAYSTGIEHGDTVIYKTEVLMLFSDSNGVLVNDTRDITGITGILKDKQEAVKNYPDLDFSKQGFTKIQKVPVDESNFMIRIINPNDFNLIYKCHYNTETKKLKLVQFLVQGKDTLFLTKPLGDSLGVYYYYAAQSIPGLIYPKKASSIDITAPKEVEVEDGSFIKAN